MHICVYTSGPGGDWRWGTRTRITLLLAINSLSFSLHKDVYVHVNERHMHPAKEMHRHFAINVHRSHNFLQHVILVDVFSQCLRV